MNKIETMIAELCPDGVEFKRLGKIGGYSKSRVDAVELNEDNYVGVDNLLPNMQGKERSNYVPTKGKLCQFEKDDILIGNIRPYLKKIWISDRTGGTNGDVLVIRISDDFRDKLMPNFLYCLLASDDFFKYNTTFAKGAKMPRGDKSAIMKYEIPIPPLTIQQKIVNILDKFTKLESDLEKELAAELEARRKQYEHYRSKLLTFNGINGGGGING